MSAVIEAVGFLIQERKLAIGHTSIKNPYLPPAVVRGILCLFLRTPCLPGHHFLRLAKPSPPGLWASTRIGALLAGIESGIFLARSA